MKEKKRAQWGSRAGFILAAAGSAVGLGNIWKFPGKAFEGGGAAYLIIYLAVVLAIGVPVMLSELSIGRAMQANPITAFKRLAPKYSWVGYLSLIVPAVIVCYYSHVGGWVLRYVVSYATDSASVFSEPLGYFYHLLGYDAATKTGFFPWTAMAYGAVFMAANAFILIKGVEHGIERFNKFGMPALFLILIILLARSLSLPGTAEGFHYLLVADWSKVGVDTILSALGQAFFSLSLGMGIMLTYGSYLGKKENISHNTVLICGMDTLVAFMAGFIIVPAVFATLGADKIGKGGSFAFVSLAGVFEAMPAGSFFGCLFYLLLLFAALTSCISILEGLIAYFSEHYGWGRKRVIIAICAVAYLFGCLYTCSQAAYGLKGVWFDCKNGLTFPGFGDFMEYLTDRLLIPLCALGVSIFTGWVWKPRTAIAEVRSSGALFRWAAVYSFLIKFVVPLAIIAIIVASFVTGTTLS